MEEYKTELQAYLTWADKVKRKYGWQPGQQFDSFNLNDEDYAENAKWFAKLRRLELQMSKTEISVVEKEVS